jgi:hypothetical protein
MHQRRSLIGVGVEREMAGVEKATQAAWATQESDQN